MDSPYSHHHHRRRTNHRNNHHQHQPPPNAPPPTPPTSPLFRLLIPSSKAGGIIGKGGSVIRHLRETTAARIRIVDHSPDDDERVIHVSNPNSNANANASPNLAQSALIKVFERMLKVDEERAELYNNINNNINNNNGNNGSSNSGSNGNGSGNGSGSGNGNGSGGVNGGNCEESEVICRMLVGCDEVRSVVGRAGKGLDRIREESCAQVRVFNGGLLPNCALPGDELIQITGNFQAVKKALLFVTSRLQEHFRSENCGPNPRMVPEEDVVFKLLCPVEKTGGLIGKGGCVVRGIENETGASIKINDSVTDTDERIVTISARESIDLQRSPAQDAAIRVHDRISEIGFEPGAAVVVRLLVPSLQIGCLMGKGGVIVNEMRRSTGANIRFFGRDQILIDEIVQVTGSVHSVQDVLFQMTSNIREFIFAPRQHLSQVNSSSYSSTFQELPSPSFRPRRDQFSPGRYHSPVGLNRGYGSFNLGPTHPSSFPHGTERVCRPNSEQDRHHYSGDRAPLPPYLHERPPSPNSWYPQAVNDGLPGRSSDAGPRLSGVISSDSQSTQMQTPTSVEIVVPQTLLPHVCGENRSNLGHLKQFSGADVVVHDPKPGATEGQVILSGTLGQLHTAQSLVQAFIFCGQSF